MFSWQKQYLTSERSELVRYCSCHSNIKFISSHHRVISSIYDSYHSIRLASSSVDWYIIRNCMSLTLGSGAKAFGAFYFLTLFLIVRFFDYLERVILSTLMLCFEFPRALSVSVETIKRAIHVVTKTVFSETILILIYISYLP